MIKMLVIRRTFAKRYSSTRYLVRWKQPDGTIREPLEKEQSYPGPGGFFAAGKWYASWRQLCADTTPGSHICRDVYGREVFYLAERFPCFDSYDYLNENRYYRRFFLVENGILTLVYTADDRKTVTVTQDVANLTEQQWKQMQQQSWPAGCGYTEEYIREAP